MHDECNLFDGRREDGGMTDLRDGGWATPSEEPTALALEARRRGLSYGQLAANTDRWDLCEIIRDYCAEKKRRRRGEHADTRSE